MGFITLEENTLITSMITWYSHQKKLVPPKDNDSTSMQQYSNIDVLDANIKDFYCFDCAKLWNFNVSQMFHWQSANFLNIDVP